MATADDVPARDTTFDAAQYALTYSPGSENHFWNRARNRIILRHLRRALAARDDTGGLVLDVGCGPGVVVGFLRSAGIDCRGVELGHPSVRPGVERYVTTGTDAVDLPADVRERTGIILLLDVIEHIERPAEFIGRLLAAFPRVSHLLIAVPARQELWSNYDVHFGHYLRYDKAGVAALASTAGLEVLTAKYFFNALYPVMWLANRKQDGRSLATPPPGRSVRAAHAVIGGLFQLEERLPLVGALPGTSLLAVLAVPRGRPSAQAR